MSTTAVPSKMPEDFALNIENLDKFTNSTSATFTDRLGGVKKTMAGTLADVAAKVDLVEIAKTAAINTAIPEKVAAVDASRIAAQTEITADKNAVDASRITAQAAMEMSVGSAQAQANAATIQALNLAGITSTYATLSLATAALSGIAANAFVGVLADEAKQGQSSVYQKVAGALVYVQYLAYPRKNQNGASVLYSYPRGSVLCQIGDSRTYQLGTWGQTFGFCWTGKNGIFEGWTSYNMGANGATLQAWANSIKDGSQVAAPTNADNINLWATVNANPQAIVFSLLTNDFRVSAGPAAIAGKIVTARANLADCINFLLSRTSAVIVLRMPPPIAFANPDPGGFTDCTTADDAAARSAAIRLLHLEWLNVSGRVIVADTHKGIYGYRLDSVAAAVDPEGQGALMLDTLHPTSLGATRECQMIERTINPSVPYGASFLSFGGSSDVTPIFAAAHWAKTFLVAGAGTNYLHLSRNPLDKIAKVRTGERSAALANLPAIQAAAYYSQLTDMQELRRIGQFYLYFHNTGNTFGPLKISTFTDRPVNGDFQLSIAGAFSGNTGPATAYVIDELQMPYASGAAQAVSISLNGPQPLTVGAIGSVSLAFSRGAKKLGLPVAVRDSVVSTATIGIYAANQVSGDWNAGSGSTPYPGIELGILSFGNGFRNSQFGGAGSFSINTTNWPTGIVRFGSGNDVSLTAKVLTGSIGLCGQVSIPLTQAD